MKASTSSSVWIVDRVVGVGEHHVRPDASVALDLQTLSNVEQNVVSDIHARAQHNLVGAERRPGLDDRSAIEVKSRKPVQLRANATRPQM